LSDVVNIEGVFDRPLSVQCFELSFVIDPEAKTATCTCGAKWNVELEWNDDGFMLWPDLSVHERGKGNVR